MKKFRPYGISYKTDLFKRLKDPAFAEAYLKATFEDEDRRVFLLGLRDVIGARSSMSRLARRTGISREHIYRMLSAKGNPELATLKKLLDALGLRLTVEIKPRRKKAA